MAARSPATDAWGGFMLNIFLALCSIVLCFPVGVLMALGRRSKLPILRWLSTAYIEAGERRTAVCAALVGERSSPVLYPLQPCPGQGPTRSIIVFTCSRVPIWLRSCGGGLQSVPKGQAEAAKALGLSPLRETALVTLPQALRNVIPAQIGQLISLFKDTTLAGAAMGLFEVAEVAGVLPAQGEFRGSGIDRGSVGYNRRPVLGRFIHDEP